MHKVAEERISFLRWTVILGALVLLILIIVLLTARNSEAGTINVDDDNTAGPWDGSPANPYQKIQDGIDNAGPGDDVRVWSGTYYENVVINKPITLIGKDRVGTIIDGQGGDNVVYVDANSVNIINFTVTNGSFGINLSTSSSITVIYNNISFNSYDGIFGSPSNVIIMLNNISNNGRHGIYLDSYSNNILITNNSVLSNNEHGIYLKSPSSSTLDIIEGNDILDNELHGIYIDSSSNNIPITNNTLISNKESGIYLKSSSNCTIQGNDISNNYYGVFLEASSENNITANDISNNWDGINLSLSSNNRVLDNDISSNDGYGLYLDSSSSNRIFHNGIINNTNQAYDDRNDNYWDDDYPAGGNHWSDYIGIDIFSGPKQDLLGSDGIGDEPYVIDADTKDNYPLTGLTDEIRTMHNYDGLWHNSNFTITLTAYGGKGRIDHTYYILDGETKEVAVDGHPNITKEGDNIALVYWSVDMEGNEEAPKYLYNIKLDKTSPVTSHDYDDLWHNSEFIINLTVFEETSGINEIYYRLNDGPNKTVSFHGQPFITTEGSSNTIEYWCIDNAGNEESPKTISDIKLDMTAPFTIDDYDELWHYSDFTINLTASDEVSGKNETYYRINGGDIHYLLIDPQPLITAEGENNTLEYWSSDTAGNIEEHHFVYGIKLRKFYPDLLVTLEDIVFSGRRLIEGNEICINATIHNVGNLGSTATIKFYDGVVNPESLIDSTIINVQAFDTALASIRWNPSAGYHDILISIENSTPEEPFTENNMANKNMVVEVRPVLMLSIGDTKRYKFEPGEERTLQVCVNCYDNSATNVRLIVTDDPGLDITVITPPQNMSEGDSQIFYIRIKAPMLDEKQESREEDIILQAISDEVSSDEGSIKIVVERPTAEILGLILLIGVAAIGAGILVVLGGTEIGKYALFAAALTLYARLRKEDILNHETRGMIRGYILANPGEHYNAIKRALGLKNGTLAYHLKTLEREKLIKSSRDGKYKRFYPAGMKIPEDVFVLNKIQELILGETIKNPGISQKELAEEVGLSTSTINYHIGVMQNAGYVRVKRKGKRTMCYPGNGVA